MTDIIDLIEKFNVKKVNATVEERPSPNGNGTYKMLGMTVRIGNNTSTWKLGVTKLRNLMDALPTLVNEVCNFDFSKGTWRTDYQFPDASGGKYPNKPLKMSFNHVATLYLFKPDIQQFIKDNTKKFRAPAIEDIVYSEWVNGFDVMPTIAIPCYPMQEGDTGSGLVPWTMTAKTVTKYLKYYIFEDGEDIDTKFENWAKEHPEEPCVYHGTKQDGSTYDVEFSPEQVRAWVKYSKEILRFERQNH